MLSLADAVTWSSRLVALSIALQTLELGSLRAAFAPDGPFRSEPSARGLARPLGGDASFRALLAGQLALALYLLIVGASPLFLALSATYLAVIARVGGPFNGSSDGLSLLSSLSLGLAACAPEPGLSGKIALGYLAAQTVLSYFVAGLIKLKEASWRSGRALGHFASLPKYQVPAWAQAALRRPAPARLASWAVLSFECSFPLCLAGPRVCLAYLAAGSAFHLANAALFGLNRFLLAWLAVYPIVLAVCSTLHARP